MPWGRLDDSLYDHPKLGELPADPAAADALLDTLPGEDLVRLCALGLWVRSISWCNRYLTDGEVPRRQVLRLGGSLALADALVDAKLFEKTATGYAVHDFLAFNDSRADILERRRKEAERKAEWRRRKDEQKRPTGTTNGTPSTDGANVPPSVPPSVPTGQERPSRRLSQRDSRARDVARIPTRPDPTRPTDSRDTTPQPPARGGRRTRARDLGPMRSPTRYDDLLERDDEPWLDPQERAAEVPA